AAVRPVLLCHRRLHLDRRRHVRRLSHAQPATTQQGGSPMGKRVKMIFLVPMSEATRPMVESQLPPEFRRSDIDISFFGAGNTITLADSYYDMAVMELAVIQAGIQAQEDGFDAVCINTVSDSGLAALRSRLSIPVLSPGQSAFHVASMLGHKFSIL